MKGLPKEGLSQGSEKVLQSSVTLPGIYHVPGSEGTDPEP